MSRLPHAEEILGFYVAVLEAQEPLWRWARAALSVAAPLASPGRAVEALDPVALQSRFREFLETLLVVAPRSLSEVGGRLLERPAEALAESVAVALDSTAEAGVGPWDSAGPPDVISDRPAAGRSDGQDEAPGHESRLGHDGGTGPAILFFASAFFEPIVIAARGKGGTAASAGPAQSRAPEAQLTNQADGTTFCPYCGRTPLLALLRDETQTKGQRLAVCGFCADRWTTRRAVCLACGEPDTARLLHHVSESLPHVRVEECGSCRTYHKTIDLRVEGRAVPVVDELASVELDLWAQQRGLEKLRPNLLGL